VGVSAAHPLQHFLLDGSAVGHGSRCSLLSESYPLFVSQSKDADRANVYERRRNGGSARSLHFSDLQVLIVAHIDVERIADTYKVVCLISYTILLALFFGRIILGSPLL